MKLRFGLVAICLALGGCNTYWERSDTISSTAGDAVAANMVMQMTDPWPPNSRNTNIPFDGERMQRAVERYRAGGSGGGASAPGVSTGPSQ
ncbi:hypothetical protein NK718_04960 [Alsobacter sp. SYSU M60028]|uniref:Pilus assembly protein n=1 Tax=Alsobacter ponti TaxID=2962936 RepID=A0ABT1L9T4_9HYPH|nr:hypothetical protein [Alsobacter ponti]MCP8937856.1 hypothetical protein [Alsobacter ponti]